MTSYEDEDEGFVFTRLKHFTPEERWGNPAKMNGLLLLLLDQIRDILQAPITINCGYELDGHVDKSQHPKGNAVDFVVHGIPFVRAAYLIMDILIQMQVDDVVGFGIYHDWNTPGFHLDVRGTRARWSRIRGQYVGIESELPTRSEVA